MTNDRRLALAEDVVAAPRKVLPLGHEFESCRKDCPAACHPEWCHVILHDYFCQELAAAHAAQPSPATEAGDGGAMKTPLTFSDGLDLVIAVDVATEALLSHSALRLMVQLLLDVDMASREQERQAQQALTSQVAEATCKAPCCLAKTGQELPYCRIEFVREEGWNGAQRFLCQRWPLGHPGEHSTFPDAKSLGPAESR